MVTQQDALLCSINDRLGLLCRRHGFEGTVPGEDIEAMGPGWLQDMMDAHGRIADRKSDDQPTERPEPPRKVSFF